MSEWISVKEAAEYTGYTPAHIRLLLRDGAVKGQRFGRDWFTTKQALDEYLATNPRPGPTPRSPNLTVIIFSEYNSARTNGRLCPLSSHFRVTHKEGSHERLLRRGSGRLILPIPLDEVAFVELGPVDSQA